MMLNIKLVNGVKRFRSDGNSNVYCSNKSECHVVPTDYLRHSVVSTSATLKAVSEGGVVLRTASCVGAAGAVLCGQLHREDG